MSKITIEDQKAIENISKWMFVAGFGIYWMFAQPSMSKLEEYINQKNQHTTEIIREYENTKKYHNEAEIRFSRNLNNTTLENYEQNLECLNKAHEKIDSLDARLQTLEPKYNSELETNKIYVYVSGRISEQKKKFENYRCRISLFFTSLMFYYGIKAGKSLLECFKDPRMKDVM